MGDRRKRKSLWDTEDGMSEHHSWTGNDHHSSHDSGRYHDFSSSRTAIPPKSRDHSGWPSWESIEENPTPKVSSFMDSRQNAPEGKEIGGEKGYYKNMSPGFDGMELRNYNANEYDRSHSQRYPGRGRSRSRSRSRTRGRSRSRSLSRGRGRERERGWSRSRSRSRSGGDGKDRTRSRSPIGDYRRQVYGGHDRRSGPEKSSQVCRDFASGRCKRGSQCRFSHPNSANHRNGDLMEDDTAESWRNRADNSRAPKHSYNRGSGVESRNDVSEPYHREDEQFRNKSRSEVPCKDFVRGKCRWGDTCRFSHHAASDDNSFGKSNRSASFDKDIERQPYKNGKPLCKFFAAGKCDKDNCRFSHDDAKFSNLGSRLGEVTDRTRDKSNLWNEPTWDDNTRDSNTSKSTGWGETFLPTNNNAGETNTRKNDWNGPTWDDNTRDSNTSKTTGWGETFLPSNNNAGETNTRKNDDSGANSFGNENRSWGIPEFIDNSLNSEKHPSLPGKSGSYSGGASEYTAMNNMASKEENLVLHGSQLQNQDGTVNLHGQNALQENPSISIESLQQNVYPASHIQQQHHEVAENNLTNSFGADVLNKLKDPRYRAHSILSPGQSLYQNCGLMIPGNSSIANEKGGQDTHCANPSNGLSADLNLPETHLVGNLNLQTKAQNNAEDIQSPGILEAKVPQMLPNWLANQVNNSPLTAAGQLVSPAMNPATFPTQMFVNEQSQTCAGVEDSRTPGMMPLIPDNSGNVALVNTANVQSDPIALSLGLFNPMKNVGDNNEHISHNLAQGTEPSNQMQLQRSSPLSTVGTEFDTSKAKQPEDPKLGQQEVLENSEVVGGSKAIGEDSKLGIPENKHSEARVGHGKAEEGGANKDEKGMRIFKNALIEFVKEILKPTWKEGRMSREVHKTVVKKVVDKVSSTIQADHIPKTQEKAEHYLSFSKPKITKLVQAYVERCQKADPNVPKADS